MTRKGQDNGKEHYSAGTGDAHQQETRRRNRGNVVEADWTTADPKLVLRLISAISSINGAVQFGYTRTRDQFVIRVLGDGEPFNEYLRPSEDVNYWLEGFAQDYEIDGGGRKEPSK